jgi:hypothetical protein
MISISGARRTQTQHMNSHFQTLTLVEDNTKQTKLASECITDKGVRVLRA